MNETVRQQILTYNADLPLAQAQTIPALWYTDPDLARLEQQAVFGATWQMIGRNEMVRQPGSFLTADVAGEPILVLRDGEERLRAFYNVCRHRAALLLTEPCGQVSRIRCRYHGWTYDLTGRLRGTPEFEGVADFCREEQGLVPLNVAVWGPFVWVHASRQPSPLEHHLAPFLERSRSWDLVEMHFVARREYELACNWKVFVDNYLDGGYHVNYVHPGLAGILDYSQYRSEIYSTSSVQLSPLAPPGDETSAAVAAVRTGSEVQYWWLYPNLMINLSQGVMDTNLVLPLGPERCRVVFDFYFAEPMSNTTEARIKQSIEVSHQIQLEDVGICEEVQRGLHSRAFQTGRFSVRREGPGYHFHQLLAHQLRDALQGSGN